MSFTKSLTKAQFKIDHASLQNRALVLFALLFIILVPWYFVIYTPQSQQAGEVQDHISELQDKTNSSRTKYENILNRSKNPNIGNMISQYEQVKKEIKRLNREITHYHHTYIDDKELGHLLHSILDDIKTVTIEHFSTKEAQPPIATAVTQTNTANSKGSKVPTKPESSNSGAQPNQQLLPEITRYTLSLKGDYFSILRFLERTERLKWQLFWESFTYHVELYPQGIATIEFYTLKPGQVMVAPIVTDATKGAAK